MDRGPMGVFEGMYEDEEPKTSWRTALKTYKPNPGIMHYERVIHRVLDLGIFPATPEMEAAYSEKLRDAAFAECGGVPGLITVEAPGQGMPVEAFIDFKMWKLIERYSKKQENEKVWLLPVEDDEEYVGWAFRFVVAASEDEAVAKVKKAAENLE